ncbi:hypothetical protein ACFXDI_49425, partial [Streptomyces mirabilis]
REGSRQARTARQARHRKVGGNLPASAGRALQGPTIKAGARRAARGARGARADELIHEQRGDGIMSAINFRLDVRRVPDPAGDRVVITLDGRKYLPYRQ